MSDGRYRTPYRALAVDRYFLAPRPKWSCDYTCPACAERNCGMAPGTIAFNCMDCGCMKHSQRHGESCVPGNRERVAMIAFMRKFSLLVWLEGRAQVADGGCDAERRVEAMLDAKRLGAITMQVAP